MESLLRVAAVEWFQRSPLGGEDAVKMGTWLSSELGRVKAVKKRSGAPRRLYRCQYEVAFQQVIGYGVLSCFLFTHCLSVVGFRPFFSRLCRVSRRNWVNSCHTGSWRVAGRDQPGKNPLKYSGPVSEERQCDTHSFANWAIMTWAMKRTDSEIHSFSHLAIMTRAMKRTDSEIHSFSHLAIMTRAMKRTDSEVHSFSYWAIMTRAMKRTDSEVHSFSYWPVMTDSVYHYIFFSLDCREWQKLSHNAQLAPHALSYIYRR